MTTQANLAADAVARLATGASPVTAESVDAWPSRPGLYAVYGSPEVWRTLQLGDPPDGRPLYVGKAERSLSSRDVGTHFGFAGKGGSSVTGTSTLRRTLSALLRAELGLRGRYRNPARPEKASHFGLSGEHDAALSDWMRGNLAATYWEMPTRDVALDGVETAVLRRLEPPLNIQKVSHQWTRQIKHARRVMAADCAKADLPRPMDPPG